MTLWPLIVHGMCRTSFQSCGHFTIFPLTFFHLYLKLISRIVIMEDHQCIVYMCSVDGKLVHFMNLAVDSFDELVHRTNIVSLQGTSHILLVGSKVEFILVWF